MKHPGVASRHISVGGVQFELQADHPTFLAAVDRCYRSFRGDERAATDETVELEVVPELHPPSSERAWISADVTEDAGTVSIHRGNALAEWDRDHHRCRLRQPPTDLMPTVPYVQAGFDSVLRIMLAYRMREAGGLLIHSAGLIRDGKGYLFVGRSGAGKSTVADVSAPTCTVLSDDLPLVRFEADGPRVYGTPFHGSHEDAANANAPLAGVFILRQATRNETRPAPPRVAIPLLLESTLCFERDRAAADRVLELVWRLYSSVPCMELHFTKDDTFWRCIDV